MYSAVNFVKMLLHFNIYCTYKMDLMAEATTVTKDKISFHLNDLSCTAVHLLLAKINICISLENELFFISLKLVQTK